MIVEQKNYFFSPYSPVFGLNTGKYGLEKPTYFDTFYIVYGNKLVESIQESNTSKT